MRRQVEQLAIVGDALIVDLAQHRRLHAMVEDLGRHPAQRLEGSNMAAQNGLQILVRDEAAPHHAAVAEHQREQLDDPLAAGLVGKTVRKKGKSTCACLPGGVSKRRSKACSAEGRTVRRKSFTAV